MDPKLGSLAKEETLLGSVSQSYCLPSTVVHGFYLSYHIFNRRQRIPLALDTFVVL